MLHVFESKKMLAFHEVIKICQFQIQYDETAR